MTDQEFQHFVIEKLTSIDTKVWALDTKVWALDVKVSSLETRVGALEQSLRWLWAEVHGLREEFHDFRDEERQENAVLRAISAQSFQHISDIKAEMIPAWKAGAVWKPTK